MSNTAGHSNTGSKCHSLTMPKCDEAIAGSSSEPEGGHLSPCFPCQLTPGGTAHIQGDPELYAVSGSRRFHPWVPVATPKMASPELRDDNMVMLLRDLGSEDESEPEEGGDRDQEGWLSSEDENDVWMASGRRERIEVYETEYEREERIEVRVDMDMLLENEDIGVLEEDAAEGMENEIEGRPVDMGFDWSEDFTSFTGQKETYTRVPGPTFDSHNPADLFTTFWDHEFVEGVVKETNKYAWQLILQLSDPDFGSGIPNFLNSWTETTVEEMYRFFAVLIYMSLCHRTKISEYWDTGVLGMPAFRDIISRNRFLLLTKFLHFVDNESLVSSGYSRKFSKVAPVVDHCNKKFAELYTPSQHLSLDESLRLWKGRLSWRQCIRSKAARFGIKSFELCDAKNGYLLQYRLYTGKETAMHPGPLHGCNDTTAKVVLELMESYLDVGHILVMDNWFNQLPLTRFLKSRRTDVLGTINRRRHHIPSEIRDLKPKELRRGDSVARHCGDVALFAWQDVKLVTVVSTYHQHEMVTATRAGQAVRKPTAVQEYNQYMGGVDLKDQKLSMFVMERKRNLKWYMKVFRRLMNISLLNAFIMYRHNPMYRIYSHRRFRFKVAEGLLRRYPRQSSVPSSVPNRELRLAPGKHYPTFTEEAEPSSKRTRKQLRCVRCTAQKKRVLVTIKCNLCQVPLCVGACWDEYHSLERL